MVVVEENRPKELLATMTAAGLHAEVYCVYTTYIDRSIESIGPYVGHEGI